MAKTVSKKKKTPALRIAIVVARFNEYITERLLEGCLEELQKNGILRSKVQVFWVPGAFEIPLVAQRLAKKKTVDAVICLGCIIKGETHHYELVAEATAKGLMEVALQAGKPVVFEVLATETVALAQARSQTKGINKGRDAARTAMETAGVLKTIK